MHQNPDPAVAVAVTKADILITAEEGFVAFERAVLAAQTHISACFRVFDTHTWLRSPEAKAVGQTWFDLILHKLNAGVSFSIVLSDFDPVVGTDDHRASWKSAQQLAALNELSDNAELNFQIALHPAQIGVLPKLALQGKAADEMRGETRNEHTPGLADVDEQWLTPLHPATHHQKLAVIDERQLYIGGLDLNERRYDTWAHNRPAEQTWHDVQVLVEGPVVDAARAHLETFLPVCAGEVDPRPAIPGFLRTLSRARRMPVLSMSPEPLVAEIEAAHMAAIKRTSGPIYLESQFFRHVPLAEALAEAAVKNSALDLTLVLPASPEDVAFEGSDRDDARFGAYKQKQALDVLSDGFGDRLALVSPVQRRAAPADHDASDPAILHGSPIIYVHSKVSLFGASEAIVSSANLNGRSLRWDTEAGVHLTDANTVEHLWQRLLRHWLGGEARQAPRNPGGLAKWIRDAAEANANAAPADRRHFLVPYPRERNAALAKSLPIVPDEMV